MFGKKDKNTDESQEKSGGLMSRLKGDKAEAVQPDNVAQEPLKASRGFKILRPGQKDGSEKRPKKVKKKTGLKYSKRNAFVFVAGDEGAILIFLQDGKVARRLFASGPEKEHFAPLEELISANASAPIYFLSDMIDQSYVRHTLPPVSPLSIQKLVKRRLDRDFSPDDIKGALKLEREKTGRKEWNFLLISLASSPALHRWLDPLTEMPNRFAGIYLLPVEAQHLIKGLSSALIKPEEGQEDAASAKPSQWKLLVIHDKVGGIRQVVMQGDQLIFTRLTQSGDQVQPAVVAGNIEQEILNTIEYLRRLSFSENAGLDIFMIIGHEIKEVVDVQRFGANNVKLLTAFEASEFLHLEQAALSGDRFADVIAGAHFGLQKKHILRLDSPYTAALAKLSKIQLALKAAAIIAALGISGMIAMEAFSYFSMNEDKENKKRELAGTRVELQDIERQSEALGESRDSVTDMAALYRATQALKFQPLDFVNALASMRPEGISVSQVEWEAQGAEGKSASSNSDNPPSTKEAYTIGFDLEFQEHNGSRQQFYTQATDFIAALRAAFPEFTLEHSDLAGAVKEEESLVVDFDAQDERDILAEDENIVQITMTGPTKEGS